MKVHQFYYTNYGRGYRIASSSIPNLETSNSVESAIRAAAVIWENNPSPGGTETVIYSDRIGRYLSAETIPCRYPGDTRPGFFSHVILPEKGASDGFAACLSWPEEDYEREVRLSRKLEDAEIPEAHYDLEEVCEKYGLRGERLAQLILLALRSASGTGEEAWIIHSEASYAAGCKSAREVMMLVYRLLPDALKKKAGYQSPAEEKSGGLRFLFGRPGSRRDGFFLDPDTPAGGDPDALAQEAGMRLAGLFRSDPDQYREQIRTLCRSETDDFESILWNVFRRLNKQEAAALPQEILTGNAERLLQAAEDDEGLSGLVENWFSAVEMDPADERLGWFTELSLREAVLLRDRDKKAYRRCILRCRVLLKELSWDEKTFHENLRTISGQFPSIAEDISPGLSAGTEEPEAEAEKEGAALAAESPKKEKTKRCRILQFLRRVLRR